jgi:protein-S-isoprenylcysteine O-methyltransferase Ste14
MTSSRWPILARSAVPTVFGIAAIATGANGVGNVSHAVAHSTPHTWLVAIYALLRTAVALAFVVFTLNRERAQRLRRSPIAVIACAVAIASVVAFAGPSSTTPEAFVLAGDVVAVLFCVWLLVSVAFLGRSFGVLPAARGLVTRGPYRLVRHPVYLGEIGACAGLALAAPSIYNVAVLAALCVAQGVRMTLEEGALEAAFPDYEAYARRTPRLLPRLRASRSAPFDSVSSSDGLRAGEATSAIVSRATSAPRSCEESVGSAPEHPAGGAVDLVEGAGLF